MNMLQAALDHAARRRPVFPCGSNKKPIIPKEEGGRGFLDATADEAQIRAWWARYPDALIGMPTGPRSGVWVLDVDQHGDDGEETLRKLLDGRQLPETVEALTPSGGRHIYFRWPADVEIRNSAGKLGPGLDVRGEGGYVILPPSGVNGHAYHWEGSSDPEEGARAAEAPSWLLALVSAAPERETAPPSSQEIPKGKRNDTLFRLACSLRAKDLTEAGIRAALREENAARCNPPLDDDEICRIAKSAASNPPGTSYDWRQWSGSPESSGSADTPEVGARRPPIPQGLLILPSDHYSYSDSARAIFTQIAPKHTLFVRGGSVVELVETDHGAELCILRPAAFQSRLDGLEARVVVHRVLDGKLVLGSKRCSKQTAEVLLESREAREILPRIKLLASAPVLIERDGQAFELRKGYHAEGGGILVTGSTRPLEVPLDVAVRDLDGLLRDFNFKSTGDHSRALASLVTPAMKMGGLLAGPTPVDVAEADESQSGKTLRQAITRAIYRERGYSIARREGGVGSLDESISAALLSGRAFITADNLRGRLDSQYLEAVITWPESIAVRVPHRGEVIIDARRVTFAITSNGVETTRDLANRSCIIRIRKRPHDYRWHPWPERSLLAHVEAQQAHYLGCVHAVVREWINRGKPRNNETHHDMREWAGTLDWIVQHLFDAAPLLDGHIEAQERVSNPALVWLRANCIAAEHAGLLDRDLSASAIWDLSQEEGIELPRSKGVMDELAGRRYVGQLLSKVFRGADDAIVDIDGFEVHRIEREEYIERDRKDVTVRRYRILRSVRSMRSVPGTSTEIPENDRSCDHSPHRPQAAGTRWEATL